MKKNFKSKKKIALVLGGGGVKASAFHIGVCLALKEKGFKFIGGTKAEVAALKDKNDGSAQITSYVGSSAGSFIAALLASGCPMEALVDAFQVGYGFSPSFKKEAHILKPITYRTLFPVNSLNWLKSVPLGLLRKGIVSGGLETLLKEKFKVNGLCTTKNIEKYLREHALHTNRFDSLGVDLWIMATQLNHSRRVIFGSYSETKKTDQLMEANFATISEAVAASTALPPVFAPVGIKHPNGKTMYFYDGEIRETLSSDVGASHGADLVITSYMCQPYHYTEEVGSLHQFGIPAILNQALYQVIQQKNEKQTEHRKELASIFQAIDGYFKSNSLDSEHRDKLINLLKEKTKFRSEVEYIDIKPRPQNYEMFFADHFSLNPKALESALKIGFKSAIAELRKLDL